MGTQVGCLALPGPANVLKSNTWGIGLADAPSHLKGNS